MPTVVYVSCADERQIVGFELDPAGGTLREIGRVTVPGSDAPSPSSLPLAVSPDRKWLYAALRSEPFPVATYAIEAGGSLRHAGTARLADSMCYLATDPAGVRLFAASYGGNKVAVSAIAGGIVGETLQVIATPPKAHCILPDPDGRFVYAACLGGDVILAQRFDATGLDPTPNPAVRTRAGAGPRHLAFGQGGRRLYCVNELDGTVNAYERDASTGALMEIQSVSALPHPVSGNAAAADIHLTPDGRFLYASLRTTNTLAAFGVDPATGRLNPLGHVPSELNPRGFAIEPEGKFLLCAGMDSGMVATYALDAETGALTRTSAVRAGAGANWVEALEFP